MRKYRVRRLADSLTRTSGQQVWADALQSALRAFANPTPPKPAEPKGLGAIVEDSDGERWVRVPDQSGEDCIPWVSDNSWRSWGGIDAVRVLSKGVTDDA